MNIQTAHAAHDDGDITISLQSLSGPLTVRLTPPLALQLAREIEGLVHQIQDREPTGATEDRTFQVES